MSLRAPPEWLLRTGMGSRLLPKVHSTTLCLGCIPTPVVHVAGEPAATLARSSVIGNRISMCSTNDLCGVMSISSSSSASTGVVLWLYVNTEVRLLLIMWYWSHMTSGRRAMALRVHHKDDTPLVLVDR